MKSMKRRWKRWRTEPVHPYHIVNMVFVAVILGILLYSAFFSPEPDRHPVSCIHSLATGEPCPSCGLSRAFSFLVRGEVEASRALNPGAIPVFLFFIIQLFMRGLTSLAMTIRLMPANRLALADAVLSVFIFMWAFLPLIAAA
jgi:hypothetical protein